jgi:hypothetical protein
VEDDIDFLEFSEKYPHLGKKITVLWGSAGGRELLLSLIADSRDGTRAGFSPQDAKKIFAILKKHDVLYPHLDNSSSIIPFGFARQKLPSERNVKPKSNLTVFKAILASFILILALLIFKIKTIFF